MASGLYASFFWSELAVSLMRLSGKGASGGSGAGRWSLRTSTISPAFWRSLKDEGLWTFVSRLGMTFVD